MNEGGAALSLTYIASEDVIPGYGGGMSSAKAALESDTRTLAWEAGRKYGIRVNTISAGPSSPGPPPLSSERGQEVLHRSRDRLLEGELPARQGLVCRRRRVVGLLPALAFSESGDGRDALRRQRPPRHGHGGGLERADGRRRGPPVPAKAWAYFPGWAYVARASLRRRRFDGAQQQA